MCDLPFGLHDEPAKEKVSILFETRSSKKNPVPSSRSRSFRKSLFWKCSYQSCIAKQCTVTDKFYQVCLSRRTRKWIEINSAWRSGTRRIQHKNRQMCRFLYRCGPDAWWTGLKGNLLRFIRSKNRALQKYLETTSRYSILVQSIYPLKNEDCNFTKKGPMRSSSRTHCLQSSLRTRYA